MSKNKKLTSISKPKFLLINMKEWVNFDNLTSFASFWYSRTIKIVEKVQSFVSLSPFWTFSIVLKTFLNIELAQNLSSGQKLPHISYWLIKTCGF